MAQNLYLIIQGAPRPPASDHFALSKLPTWHFSKSVWPRSGGNSSHSGTVTSSPRRSSARHSRPALTAALYFQLFVSDQNFIIKLAKDHIKNNLHLISRYGGTALARPITTRQRAQSLTQSFLLSCWAHTMLIPEERAR